MNDRRKTTVALIAAALLSGSVLVSGGCKDDQGNSAGASAAKHESTPAERVGVVDLDKVATDLGWKAKLQTTQNTYLEQLKKEMLAVATTYRQQLADKRKSFGKDSDPMTSDQQQMMMNMVGAYNQIVQALDQQAGKLFQAYGQESANRYREALQPVIRSVAQERKVGVVMTQLSNIVYTDPSLDLTNAVVDAARKTPPTLTDVPMTSLQGAPAELPSTLPTPSSAGTTQPSSPATKP